LKHKVGVFCGSYNPIHKGHIEVAETARYLGGFDEVWIQPCLRNPARNDLMEYKHRLKMCELATEGLKGISESSFEKYMENYEGSTYAMWRALRSCYFPYQFTLIIGSSNAVSVPKWKNGDKIVKEIPCFVVAETPRGTSTDDPEFDVDDPEHWFRQYPHKLMKMHTPPTVSGTTVRHYLNTRQLDEVAKRVPDKVFQYLKALHGI
jgi:nicotinate-nucleotide adenylyltransferase